MTDLWDPAKRAKLCMSCHIGSADTEDEKIVTHEMYAAGHPPLPSVELETFSTAMPKHWQYLANKSSEVQNLLKYDHARLEQVELVIVSAAVSLRESMGLLASQARKCAKALPSDSGNRVLDLANFDCYACHHELKMPSWRAQRGYHGIPGRPQPRRWPLALIKVAVWHSEFDQTQRGTNEARAEAEFAVLVEHLKKLSQAFDVRPLGDPQAVVEAADAIHDWASKLVDKLKSSGYDQEAASRLLVQLCALPKELTTDYDSARQIVWAIKSIYDSLPDVTKRENNAEIKDLLKRLDEELFLALSSGQLPRALQAIADYDPAEFGSRIKQLANLLK